MADRVVSYTFKGNFTNLTAGLAATGKAVGDVGDKMTSLDKNGAKMRASLTSMGGTAGKIGLVAAAGLGVAVTAAANFDKSMSAVQAATHETSSNMELLRAAAIKAGADTAYSATEAAGAIEQLSKAGVSTKDVLAGGLSGALSLAAAGQLEVADAAEIAASALTQFQLSGKDVPHVADLLAAGAGKAQGSVQDLGYALKYAGVPANALGVSIEETTGVLAEFASTGIVGEQAGTTLRSMLLSLAAPTSKASEVMETYGLNLYDAQGKFVGLQGAAQQLHDKLGPLDDATRNAALSTIFGTNAIQGAISLYQGGGQAVSDWTKKVDDSGYAAKTAAIQMDNLSGDFEQFKGSLETALIGAGEGSQGPLRELVQGATKAVNAFNALPGPVKSTTTALMGLVAVTGGAAFFGAKIVSGIASTKSNLVGLGLSAEKASSLMRGVAVAGSAISGAAVGISLVATAVRSINSASRDALPGVQGMTQELTNLVNTGTASALSDQFSDLGADLHNLFDKGTVANVEDFMYKWSAGQAILGDTQAVTEAKDEINALDAALANIATTRGPEAAAQALQALADSGAITADQLAYLRKHLPQYDEALAGIANSAEDAAAGTDQFGGAAAGATPQVKAMSEAMAASRKAARETAGSFFNLGDSLNDSKKSLGEWIAQMRGQAEALHNFRINAETAAKKGLRQGLIAALQDAGPEGAMRMKQLANATKSEIAKANAAWLAGQREINKYTDAVGGVPTSHGTTLTIRDLASPKIGALKSELASIVRHIDIYIQAHASHLPNMGGMGPQIGSADGSTVPKDGKPYGDRYPYLLAPGEEVISNRSGQADKWRPLLKAINAGHLADGGTVRGLANGGTASRMFTSSDGVDALNRTAQSLADTQKKQNEHLKHEMESRKKLLENELKRDEHEVERDKKRLDALKQELQTLEDSRRQLMQQVASQFKTDIFGSGFDPAQFVASGGSLGADFGNQVYAYAQANGLSGTYNIADWAQQYIATLSPEQQQALQAQAGLGQLKQDAANADAFQKALKKAKRHGLSGGLLHYLEASGNLGAAQQFASMSASEIAAYEKAYKNRQYEVHQTARMVGNDKYAAAIHDQSKLVARQTRVLEAAKNDWHEAKESLHRVEKRLSSLEHATSETGPKNTGKAVGQAINNAVSHGQRSGK